MHHSSHQRLWAAATIAGDFKETARCPGLDGGAAGIIDGGAEDGSTLTVN
jgi:hypothetical protein